jgi:hypothetical protein
LKTFGSEDDIEDQDFDESSATARRKKCFLPPKDAAGIIPLDRPAATAATAAIRFFRSTNP